MQHRLVKRDCKASGSDPSILESLTSVTLAMMRLILWQSDSQALFRPKTVTTTMIVRPWLVPFLRLTFHGVALQVALEEARVVVQHLLCDSWFKSASLDFAACKQTVQMLARLSKLPRAPLSHNLYRIVITFLADGSKMTISNVPGRRRKK